MKGNIKRLAVFTIIAAIAMFMAVAVVSAGDYLATARNKTIHAEYAFTGSGNCLIAISGLNASLQPNDGANGLWFGGPLTIDEGIIKFNKDGTGTLTDVLRAFDYWSPGFPPTAPDAGAANEIWDFTYTMTNKGDFKITYTKGTSEIDFTSGPNAPPSPLAVQYFIFPPVKGKISLDGKILNAWWGPPDIYVNTSDKENNNTTGVQAVCSVVIQGFRTGP